MVIFPARRQADRYQDLSPTRMHPAVNRRLQVRALPEEPFSIDYGDGPSCSAELLGPLGQIHSAVFFLVVGLGPFLQFTFEKRQLALELCKARETCGFERSFGH